MSGSGKEAGVKGVQAAVAEGQIVLVWDVNGGSVGGIDGGGGGGVRDGYGDGDELNLCEDNVANVILRTETNTPLAYAPLLEIHHPIMSNLGGHGGRLEIDI